MMVMQSVAGNIGVVMMVQGRRGRMCRMSRMICAANVADVARNRHTDDEERERERREAPDHLKSVYRILKVTYRRRARQASGRRFAVTEGG
jgi:hypothetical protein